MSAQDYLHPLQFAGYKKVAISKLMKMPSGDLRGEHGTVAEAVAIKRQNFGQKKYQKYAVSMAREGQKKPILIEHGYVTGGHHRIGLAHDLGWTHMWTTGSIAEHGA